MGRGRFPLTPILSGNGEGEVPRQGEKGFPGRGKREGFSTKAKGIFMMPEAYLAGYFI